MNNWSLIIFTLCTQCAIGLSWIGLIGRFLGLDNHILIYQWSLAVALLVIMAAILSVFGHLQNPFHAPLALKNLKTSWLSREVTMLILFTGLILILLFISWFDLGVYILAVVLEIAACFAGGLVLLTMTKIYLLKTVPAWNHLGTPLEFAGSALLLGGAFELVICAAFWEDYQEVKSSFGVGGLAFLIGTGMKLLAIRPALTIFSEIEKHTWYKIPDLRNLYSTVLIIRLAGLFLSIILFITAWNYAGKVSILLLFISLFVITTGEIIGRWYFYRSYIKIGV